jgi:pimeloyl-ACP methyl ester carboxylesterase
VADKAIEFNQRGRNSMKKNAASKALMVSFLAALLGIMFLPLARGQNARLSPLHSGRRFPERLLSQGPAGQVPRLMATASSDIVWVQCPPPAQALGAMCGKLPVPLDRRNPKGQKIGIYFEQYFHTNSGPAESAILLNPGGPGVAIATNRLLVFALFGQNTDIHDFLLIDDRGRGFSQTIDCPELQHGTASFEAGEIDCAAQLGPADSWYGTGDIAMDTDAVRAALGYEKVDYWGASYGGEDVSAYATRFGQHLRSIVLDAPMGTPGLRPFLLDGDNARATAREVRLDCQRSPACSADHSDPDSEFAQLIQSVRSRPVQGWAYNASGVPVHVQLDEGALLYLSSFPTISFPYGFFVSAGEISAAGTSLSQGDPGPLLRLGAEVTPFITDYGDPTASSQGDYVAAMCVDFHEPWEWSDTIPQREEKFANTISELSPDFFAPFSHAAGTNLGVSLEKQCLWWQKPTPSSPVVPLQATYPNVPTLVMSGDMDTLVASEEVAQVAALFPGSTFVKVAEAGHLTAFWTQCAATLQSQFLETLQIGDTSCTQTPETIWPAVGKFPLIAANAIPAAVDPSGNNEIGEHERKVVSIAVATAIDALKRSAIGIGNGVGLRAGTFQTSFDANGNQIMTLAGCMFAKDVTVNGTLVWNADRSVGADVTVSGPGSAGGTLHIEGYFQAPGPVGEFKVSGILGGRQVAVLVPEA